MEFNWKIYKELNKDLHNKLTTRNQYKNHYVEHGKKEGRKASVLKVNEKYNSQCYRYNNIDLENQSVEDLELHYVIYGKNENRVCEKKKLNVYIISNIEYGGSVKYIKDLMNGFPNNKYIIIRNRHDLLSIKFRDTDLVLLQQLLYTKINCIDLINLKKKYKFRLILSIHDFYWLNINLLDNLKVNPHSRYLETSEMLTEVKQLIEICDEVIHPSKFTYENYSRYISNKNFRIIPHNDASVNHDIANVPTIVNNLINIGFLHDFIEVKGGEYIVKLFEKYRKYRDYNVDYFVVKKNIRPYNEEEYFDYIEKLNLHCLTFLSKWGETWSYSLTKAINTGLPIIYNNFGVFRERIPKREDYFVVHEEEKTVENHERLYSVFEKLLDYIIENNGKVQEMNRDSIIVYQSYYKRLLNTPLD